MSSPPRGPYRGGQLAVPVVRVIPATTNTHRSPPYFTLPASLARAHRGPRNSVTAKSTPIPSPPRPEELLANQRNQYKPPRRSHLDLNRKAPGGMPSGVCPTSSEQSLPSIRPRETCDQSQQHIFLGLGRPESQRAGLCTSSSNGWWDLRDSPSLGGSIGIPLHSVDNSESS